MKTSHPFAIAVLFCCLFSISAAQEGSAESTELVRVKPADIGPKQGRESNEVVKPGGEPGESVPAGKQNSAGTLEIIFDASNSMNAKMGGVPKINLAKEAMYHLLDVLEGSSFATGFRVFGHDKTISREDLKRACQNSELVVPIGQKTASAIRSRIPGMIAWGRTPIAYSLEKAGEDLDDYLESNPMVLLISDGVESCNGKPLKVISDLQERGIKFQTHVIGFDLNPDERKALERISMIGNGNYYDARNLGELLKSLDQFARDAKVAVPPEPPVYLNPVVGGSSFDESTEIGPGTYTIRDTLGKGEFAWFRVASKKGQRVAVRAKVQGAKMIRNGAGKLIKSSALNGGTTVQFVRNDRPERAFSTIQLGSSSEVGDWIRTHVLDLTGEGSVFRVGAEFSESSPNALLEVMVQEAGDLYEGYDAPDSQRADDFIDAPLNDTFYGHIGAQDRKDAFRVPLGETPLEKVKVSVKFSDVDEPVRHKVEVFDGETKRRLHRTPVSVSKSEIEVPTEGAKSLIVLIHDDLANSILRTYMNSYEIRISSE